MNVLTLNLNMKDCTFTITTILIELHKAGFKNPTIYLPLDDYMRVGIHPSNMAFPDYVKNNPYEGYSLFGVKFKATDEDTIATNGAFNIRIDK